MAGIERLKYDRITGYTRDKVQSEGNSKQMYPFNTWGKNGKVFDVSSQCSLKRKGSEGKKMEREKLWLD